MMRRHEKCNISSCSSGYFSPLLYFCLSRQTCFRFFLLPYAALSKRHTMLSFLCFQRAEIFLRNAFKRFSKNVILLLPYLENSKEMLPLATLRSKYILNRKVDFTTQIFIERASLISFRWSTVLTIIRTSPIQLLPLPTCFHFHPEFM